MAILTLLYHQWRRQAPQMLVLCLVPFVVLGAAVLMNRLAAQGKAIVMISSELPEVLGMADRILVMHEGRITGEIAKVDDATQEQIMDFAVR